MTEWVLEGDSGVVARGTKSSLEKMRQHLPYRTWITSTSSTSPPTRKESSLGSTSASPSTGTSALPSFDQEEAEERYRVYTRNCLSKEQEPMYWGDWVRAGMPG